MLKRVGRLLLRTTVAVALAAVVAYVVLFVVNLRDRDPGPAVALLEQQLTDVREVPDDDNTYLVMLGIRSPARG